MTEYRDRGGGGPCESLLHFVVLYYACGLGYGGIISRPSAAAIHLGRALRLGWARGPNAASIKHLVVKVASYPITICPCYLHCGLG